MKAARPPVCMQDVRGVWPERRSEEVAHRGEVGRVGGQLLTARPPSEVGVGLIEADLGQTVHHGRPGEGLGEHDDVGVLITHRRDHPFPEWERLGVGVVDPEDPDPLGDPVVEHALQRRPEPLGVLGLEVERIDVLVLLGWVLRVLHAAVGAMAEPFRVLADPGVIGRALEGDVQGQLQTVLGCRVPQ